MSKKDFTGIDNPALQHISTAQPKKAVKKRKPQPTQSKQQPLKEGYKMNPAYIETRSERINLLAQPSLKQRIEEYAKDNKTSMNDTIHSLVDEALHKAGY